MPEEWRPFDVVAEMVAARASLSDVEVLAELTALPPLPDESDPAWEQDATWQNACRFVALADLAAARRLKPAIRLLLDRVCYGDPGEMFRGLRHASESIVTPNWSDLVDICLAAAASSRLGTRLWAIDQLAILDDERARAVFESSIRSDPEEIKSRARIGLNRLDRQRESQVRGFGSCEQAEDRWRKRQRLPLKPMPNAAA